MLSSIEISCKACAKPTIEGKFTMRGAGIDGLLKVLNFCSRECLIFWANTHWTLE